MDFNILIQNIKETHDTLYRSVTKSINVHLTLRNLLTGFYIVEFEQKGKDRAEYGTKLLQNLAKKIKIKGLSAPELSRCRQFYNIYYPILGSATQKFKNILPQNILGTLSQELKNNSTNILGTLSQELQETNIEDENKLYVKIFSSISYSHFIELIKINDPLKRKFYELIILNSQLSVRELKSQIESLSFERVGLSQNNETAYKQLIKKIEPQEPADIIKSYYFFDFLKYKNPGLIEETELEEALITHLQEFIIELGNGFCFEARQKRILIEDEYFFIDLVFYHRVLKCHVIIELKTRKAKHEHIGQLKSYIQFYKKKVMLPSDNPPVGILLVTDKNKTLVEYAVADSDKELFVSKYALKLPKKEELQNFIDKELKNI
ncbi:MAG: PDDEXK nuclease domain-containing protein [Bacteroidota bacterium]|nr:PDDEXK nuclease domain-containing protein [Bacteroidota bacterium]